ncbi:chemotaxis protein methyltransferase CheR [Pseudomonas duriflava]|uniref:Chemotaxis protein methyltransferase n=1 Tax=Pseudomonas duriflava TaxID=459528 RepID=A0A562QDL6_9PSED|nr:protein-glutamate O-methyltransferase CheR [Pseudomonas duriflava]TWI54857.1 chemotaxis protein methyltransferase CheR [Pseudomonas duriflava]
MDNLALSDSEFKKFRGLIYEVAGISMSEAKKPLVSGRLAKRVRQQGLPSYSAYFDVLMRDRAEFQAAVDLLTTNETYFFREPKHFEFLQTVALPELRDRASLRIWSGACSTGEEPYTLALVLADTLGMRPWEILASDISTRVLEKARRGQYPLDDAEGIPKAMLHKYCFKGISQNTGTFLVGPDLASRITFRQINLNTTLPDVGQFDVIFLRNVMIYFDNDTKRQVMQRLVSHLRPGGYFMISHSESLNGVTDALKMVKPSIYQKPYA